MDYISIVSQLGHCLRVSYYILSIVVNIDQISHTDKFDYEESSGAKFLLQRVWFKSYHVVC